MRIHTALPTALVCLTLITSSCTTAPTHPASFAGSAAFAADADPLPSWNDGPAKKAILDFVKTTTDKNNPKFVPPEERIATFDQDGTTWVEQPIYSQVLFAFDRVAEMAPQHPEWKTKKPFKAILTGDKEAMAKFTLKDIEALLCRNSHRHDRGGLPTDRQGLDGESEASTLRPAISADGVPADAGGHEVSARQRLRDLHRDGWRTGFRPCLRAAGLRHSARADDRLGAHIQYQYNRMERAS